MLPQAETIRPVKTSIPPSAALRPLALFAIVFGAFSSIADPDLWGHLRFGLDILASGDFTPSDIYSFTADRPWVNHEWMFEALLAVAYTAAGPAGLMFIKAVLAATPAVLTWSVLRSTSYRWRWLAVAIVGWGTLALAFTLRPQLATGIGLFLVGHILTSASPRRLWFLPPIFALWANMHGGWIVGGAVLGIWTAAAWVQQTPLRWHLLLVGITSLGATLLTPYGIDLWKFLAETVRLNRQDISEWLPIWRSGPGFPVMWSVTLATLALSWRRWGRPPAAVLVTLVAFAYASARVNRLVPLFVVLTVTMLSRQWPPQRSSSPPQGKAVAIFDGFVVAICIVLAVGFGGIRKCISIDHFAAPDTAGAESLRGVSGRLVTLFDWGEYALWHFGPALRVSIDGRRETLYSSALIEEQQAIPRGEERGLRALEQIGPEYVWLPSTATTAADWLVSHGYRMDVRTERSYVAVRADLPPVAAWTGMPSGCFPGP